jgi:hypothetical protein
MNSLCTLVCECVTSSSQWIKHKSHYNACVWRNSFLLMFFFFFFLISQSIIYQKKAQSASNYTRMRTQSASSIQKKPKPTTQGTHKRTSKYTKSIQRNPKKKNPKQPKSSKGPKNTLTAALAHLRRERKRILSCLCCVLFRKNTSLNCCECH